MKNRSILVSAILVIVCLTGGIQRQSFVGSLKTSDGAQLAEQDGRLILITGRNGIAPRLDGVALAATWKISSPYLQSGGKFLAMDQSETGVKVYLAAKKDETTKWVIEVLKTTSPQSAKSSPRMLEGTSASRFRLKVFEGHYKGWYLAAKEPTEEQANAAVSIPMNLDFHVVQNPKQALTFDYVDTSYSVHHK